MPGSVAQFELNAKPIGDFFNPSLVTDWVAWSGSDCWLPRIKKEKAAGISALRLRGQKSDGAEKFDPPQPPVREYCMEFEGV